MRGADTAKMDTHRTQKEQLSEPIAENLAESFDIFDIKQLDQTPKKKKIDILQLSFDDLKALDIFQDVPQYRVQQVFDWLHLHKVPSFFDMQNVPNSFRQKLDNTCEITTLTLQKSVVSKDGKTEKYLFSLSDNYAIETVFMQQNHGNTVCISSQVGCGRACVFCASGKNGLVRNLTASEMLAQVYETEKINEEPIHSLVLMGIGEPLDNLENVLKFLKLIELNMSKRNISLSTCGVVPKIYELARERLGLTLCISLHAANDERRAEIMPVAKAYNIESLIKAAKFYQSATSRRVTVEYAVSGDKQIATEEATSLVKLLKGSGFHVNLIPINSISGNNSGNTAVHSTCDITESLQIFGDILQKAKINVTVRKSLGADIRAACGQLAYNVMSDDW
jgi:23S rRNA (adenine2503-C2)-methyltransferase